jgi:hypothetical protein
MVHHGHVKGSLHTDVVTVTTASEYCSGYNKHQQAGACIHAAHNSQLEFWLESIPTAQTSHA